MANLSFTEIRDNDGGIRVVFAQGNGSWSYLGMQAQSIPVSELSMNFGRLTRIPPTTSRGAWYGMRSAMPSASSTNKACRLLP
ncbi:hypothetical protein ACFQ36_08325 [Arthrobacter sp. GCM10027362]|uniref:hypothetical protein n=1 Tax=Arthrobacter sp. GCM10027362 TaxID=3273379 RepID=UPI00363C5B60